MQAHTYDTPDARDVSPETWSGAAWYSGLRLRFFVPLTRLNCWLLWRCPVSRLVQHHGEHASGRHLDIGVGDGSLLDSGGFPTAKPSLTLMDLNPDALAAAAVRLKRHQPATHLGNVLEASDLPAGPFDSVGMTFLLHCLPGDMSSKAAAFENARTVLAPGGTLFGATVLNGGVEHTRMSRGMLDRFNRSGFFCNLDDDLTGLRAALDASFTDTRIEVVGAVALFSAVRDGADAPVLI
jgi:SAM-dependent methyltransferase